MRSECSPSPINIGEGALSLQGNAVFYAIVSEPTSDTDRMMNEVGALYMICRQWEICSIQVEKLNERKINIYF